MKSDGFTEKEEKGVWRSFIRNTFFILILFVLGLYIGLFVNNKKLIESEILSRAKAHFENIVLTRQWNAMYGGVFVEKKPGMESNPYLENPDIHTVDGKVYTKKNPALMTREISEIAEQNDQYRFHITSLNPLNPNNAADTFESEALKAFEQGETERYSNIVEGDKVFFRYMAPLFTQETCLECHAKQGYKIGEIRGGISVKFDITSVSQAIKTNKLIIVILFILTTVVLVGLISFFIWKLNKKLSEAMRKVKEMAITDELTQLFNRRYGFIKLNEEFSRSKRYEGSFSLLLMDIDFFKKVNDTHGHQAGDLVLARTASYLKMNIRSSDFAIRYGGEEFAIFLPETEMAPAKSVAEKLRQGLESIRIPFMGHSLSLTASFGGVVLTSDDLQKLDGLDEIIAVADKALYLAKANGRNRVEWHEMP